MKTIRLGGMLYMDALWAAIRSFCRSTSMHIMSDMEEDGSLAKAMALPPQPQNASSITMDVVCDDGG